MSSDAAESNSPPDVASPEPSVWFRRAIAATTFLGAFLLFQVQPLIGEVVLPWFGGSSSVWTTSLLFFQAMLVAGYAFVYLTTRFLPPIARSALYVLSAAACVAALPILPDASRKPTPETDPATGVLWLLLISVGAPYFLLATTGPATQEWYARAYRNRSPYRLYSLSNLGSLLGLLTYPFVVQPAFDLTMQSKLWSIGFGFYAVFVAFCAWIVKSYGDLPLVETESASKPVRAKGRSAKSIEAPPSATRGRFRETAFWLGLSAGGSALMLVTMNHLCQDMSAFPLVRIAPLVVYLITFIICFDRPAWYHRRTLATLALILVPLACWPTLYDPAAVFVQPRFLQIAVVNLALVFVGCMLFHGELAARKPVPQRLTFYYLMIAVGGAIGGLFVGFVAPLIYDRYWEWILSSPAMFLFAAIVLVDCWYKAGFLRSRLTKALVVTALLYGLFVIARNHTYRVDLRTVPVASARNFYGVVQVDHAYKPGSEELLAAIMYSGSTQHGQQVFTDPFKPADMSHSATAYYTPASGIGRLLRGRPADKPLRVGAVGLGVGTLAAYARKGDSYYFYEINPIVRDFANEYFTYLKDCFGSHEVILGDARLSLEREPNQEFDVIILDAFSSDSIPTHLLTTEAFEIYLRHLAPDGVIAVHISNRYLNLAPVTAAAAAQFNLQGKLIRVETNRHIAQLNSRWVLMTRNPQGALWKGIAWVQAAPLEEFNTIKPWTDQHSSFWDVLE